MSKLLSVAVTAEHIRRGKRRNPHSCPVALALTDVLGPDFEVEVGESNHIIAWNKHDYPYAVRTPLSVDTFRRVYDSGTRVQPIQFEASIDQPSLLKRLIYHFRGPVRIRVQLSLEKKQSPAPFSPYFLTKEEVEGRVAQLTEKIERLTNKRATGFCEAVALDSWRRTAAAELEILKKRNPL